MTLACISKHSLCLSACLLWNYSTENSLTVCHHSFFHQKLLWQATDHVNLGPSVWSFQWAIDWSFISIWHWSINKQKIPPFIGLLLLKTFEWQKWQNQPCNYKNKKKYPCDSKKPAKTWNCFIMLLDTNCKNPCRYGFESVNIYFSANQ